MRLPRTGALVVLMVSSWRLGCLMAAQSAARARPEPSCARGAPVRAPKAGDGRRHWRSERHPSRSETFTELSPMAPRGPWSGALDAPKQAHERSLGPPATGVRRLPRMGDEHEPPRRLVALRVRCPQRRDLPLAALAPPARADRRRRVRVWRAHVATAVGPAAGKRSPARASSIRLATSSIRPANVRTASSAPSSPQAAT